MKKLFKKLSARRGASITIALLLFMLCSLAGVSALMMASANTGRYAHNIEDQQPYYSVTSAALLFVNLIDEDSSTKYTSGSISYDYTRKWTYENGSEHTQSEGYTLSVPNGTLKAGRSRMQDTKLLEAVRKHCDELVPYLNVPEEWYATLETPETVEEHKPEKSLEYNFTIKSTDKIGDVNGTLIMNDNYDLWVTFAMADDDKKAYSVNLYWRAEVSDTTKSEPPKYDFASNVYEGSVTIKQVKTVEVKWRRENVTISRGEADIR